MDFQKRNEIRAQQVAFKWYPQVGDRVQLSEPTRTHTAWESGTLIALNPSERGMDRTPYALKTVQMDDGGILEETMKTINVGGFLQNELHLVPHEDYFLTDEDAAE